LQRKTKVILVKFNQQIMIHYSSRIVYPTYNIIKRTSNSVQLSVYLLSVTSYPYQLVCNPIVLF